MIISFGIILVSAKYICRYNRSLSAAVASGSMRIIVSKFFRNLSNRFSKCIVWRSLIRLPRIVELIVFACVFSICVQQITDVYCSFHYHSTDLFYILNDLVFNVVIFANCMQACWSDFWLTQCPAGERDVCCPRCNTTCTTPAEQPRGTTAIIRLNWATSACR